MDDRSDRSRALFVPVTRLGRWALGLTALSLVSLAVFYMMVALGERGGASILDNWLLTGPILVVAVAGTAALIAGTAATLARGERNLGVLLGVLYGLLVTVFWVAEIIAPH